MHRCDLECTLYKALLLTHLTHLRSFFPGAFLMVIANILSHTYMIEPNKDNVMVDPIKTRSDKFTLSSEDEDVKRPDNIDQKTLWNIVGGALLDNIGSTGLFPLCLSPLALQAYYGQFVAKNEEPIMSILGCKSFRILEMFQ